ncbi:MAG: hypothetical protein QM777_16875 [Pseudorhodoferax sp.]
MMALLVSAQDRKRRDTATARAILAGALLAITDDDHGRPLFVLTYGATTHRADSLDQLESLLDEIELKERHV